MPSRQGHGPTPHRGWWAILTIAVMLAAISAAALTGGDRHAVQRSSAALSTDVPLVTPSAAPELGDGEEDFCCSHRLVEHAIAAALVLDSVSPAAVPDDGFFKKKRRPI